jgi:PIN domain nuclease of toxin-antitoxin system
MRLLLDTHALLWWIFDDPKLTKAARRLIADPDNEAIVSAAAGWEIATKHRLGKLPDVGDVAVNLAHYLRRARMSVLPVNLDHALAAGGLPGPHRDPFDRMMVAQAKLEKLAVITADPVFSAYGVRVRW